jgi:hypothetical protein
MMTKLRSKFATLPQQLLRDTRGITLAFVALAGSVLIGFTGLAVETGLWYAIKRVNQSVADGAALSGAMELLAGYTTSSGLTEVQQMGTYAAKKNGFTPAATICGVPTSGQISVCQCYNYSVGGTCTAPAGIQAANAVEAIVAQQQSAVFASLFLPSVSINTRAVAALKALDNPCMLSLAPSGTGIEVQGASAITTPGCSIVADSSGATAINIHDNGGSITADTLVTAGGIGYKGNPVVPPFIPAEFSLASPPTVHAANFPDPYSATLTHAFDITGMPTVPPSPPCTLAGSTWSGNCAVSGLSLSGSGSPITLTGNTQISGGWDIKNQTVDLKPGTYWITNGDLTLDTNAAVTCSTCTAGAGVTIILTKTGAGTVGGFCSVSNSSVTLNAPTSGTYSGYLIIQDPGATTGTSSCKKADNSFQGGASMNLTGLLYFPNTTVIYQGNPNSTCSFLIAKTIVLNGNSNFSTSGCANAGLNLPTVQTVALAE